MFHQSHRAEHFQINPRFSRKDIGFHTEAGYQKFYKDSFKPSLKTQTNRTNPKDEELEVQSMYEQAINIFNTDCRGVCISMSKDHKGDPDYLIFHLRGHVSFGGFTLYAIGRSYLSGIRCKIEDFVKYCVWNLTQTSTRWSFMSFTSTAKIEFTGVVVSILKSILMDTLLTLHQDLKIYLPAKLEIEEFRSEINAEKKKLYEKAQAFLMGTNHNLAEN